MEIDQHRVYILIIKPVVLIKSSLSILPLVYDLHNLDLTVFYAYFACFTVIGMIHFIYIFEIRKRLIE